MIKPIKILGVLILLLSSHYLLTGYAQVSGSVFSFAIANVHFEQNATDGDVEVVFEVKGGDEGLIKLIVISPDGRTIIDFSAPDTTTLGLRQFKFESPEPKDVESLKSAYPEGNYTFSGITVSGDKFSGESTLSHQLPPVVSFIFPSPEQENVSVTNLVITWTKVEGASAYIIEISQEDLDINLTVKLKGIDSALAVPDGFLLPDLKYKLSIGIMSEEGNLSFVETSFTTAGGE